MLKVTHASAVDNQRLYVEFNDGRKGYVDVSRFFISPFFKQLEEASYFSKVALFFTGIGWPNGQDLGPDTLAAFLEPSGKQEKKSA